MSTRRPALAGPAPTDTGCSAAWIAHLTGGQGVAGSNPAIPTKSLKRLTATKIVAVFYGVSVSHDSAPHTCDLTPGLATADAGEHAAALQDESLS